MKIKVILRLLVGLVVAAAIIGAYMKGRNDVLISEFKMCDVNLLKLTRYETNQPPELKEFIKARYYYLANKIPKKWVGEPHDYGDISTNIARLAVFKGPSSGHEEYQMFLNRFALGSLTP